MTVSVDRVHQRLVSHRCHGMPVVMLVPMRMVLLIPLPVYSVGQDATDQGYPGQHSVEASSQDIDPGHIVGHLHPKTNSRIVSQLCAKHTHAYKQTAAISRLSMLL